MSIPVNAQYIFCSRRGLYSELNILISIRGRLQLYYMAMYCVTQLIANPLEINR